MNSTYGIRLEYPSDWTIQESNATDTLINIATFVSPTGPDSDPTADISIYIDKLHNSATNLNNYAHFVASTDYENNFHDFKLLELSTNSSILGKSAYTYQDPSAGSQKIMEVGTIIGDKAYSVQYIADAPRYNDYLPTVQKMIDSMQITSQGNGPYGMTMGPNGTMTVTNGSISGTLTAPRGTVVSNIKITPLNYTHLDGTWNFMDGNGTTSGQITFGTEELKCNWCHGDERQYGFSGIFSGQPISGTYTYTIPGAYQLGLMYTYHHHTVAVIGWLHKINPDHMELTDITSYETHKAAYSASDFNKVATGLHLYHGDVIHLMRGDMSNMNMN